MNRRLSPVPVMWKKVRGIAHAFRTFGQQALPKKACLKQVLPVDWSPVAPMLSLASTHARGVTQFVVHLLTC
jgi:hypothetical protein